MKFYYHKYYNYNFLLDIPYIYRADCRSVMSWTIAENVSIASGYLLVDSGIAVIGLRSYWKLIKLSAFVILNLLIEKCPRLRLI